MNDYVQMYETISVIGYIAAGLFLAVAVFLFFFLDIKGVAGFLSGRTQKKAIEAIRAGTKQKKDLSSKEIPRIRHDVVTDDISTKELQLQAQASMNQTEETTLLPQTPETVLLQAGQETTLLTGGMAGQTTELSGYAGTVGQTKAKIVIEEEITFIHTEERISEEI